MIFPLEEQKKKSKQERRLFLEELPAKRNTRNQKQFEKILVMQYQNVKLTVGLQRSNQDLVQIASQFHKCQNKQSHQLMFE